MVLQNMNKHTNEKSESYTIYEAEYSISDFLIFEAGCSFGPTDSIKGTVEFVMRVDIA